MTSMSLDAGTGSGWTTTVGLGVAGLGLGLAAAAYLQLLPPLHAVVGLAGAALLAAGASYSVAIAARRRPDLRALAMELGGDGTWVYHLRTNQIRYDDRCGEMLGYERGRVADRLSAWGKLVHPDDLEHARKALDDFIDGGSDRYEVQVRLRDVRGCWRKILDRGRVVRRDADGKPTLIVGVHRLLATVAPEPDVAVDQSGGVRGAARWLLSEIEEQLRSASRQLQARNDEADAPIAEALARARDSFRRYRSLDAIADREGRSSDVPAVLRAIIARRRMLTPGLAIDARLPSQMRKVAVDEGVLAEVLTLVIDALASDDPSVPIVVREGEGSDGASRLTFERDEAELAEHLPRLRAATALLRLVDGRLDVREGNRIGLQLPVSP